MNYKLVQDVSEEFTGTAKHIRFVEEIDVLRYDGTVKVTTSDFVISQTNVMYSGPETFIFPADSNGNVVEWGELETSRKGSHGWEAIADATAAKAADGEIRG